MNEFFRGLLHLPVGAFAAFLIMCVGEGIGITFAFCFLIFEILEDWRIKDRSYQDVLGFLVGLGVGAVVLFVTQGGGL